MDLFEHVWWAYNAGEGSLGGDAYHYFNLCEAACWFCLASAVLARGAKNRRSLLEPLYALAFLAFGATDVLEASSLTSWLILLKGANLIALLWLRAVVIRRFYPDRRLYRAYCSNSFSVLVATPVAALPLAAGGN